MFRLKCVFGVSKQKLRRRKAITNCNEAVPDGTKRYTVNDLGVMTYV